MIKQKLLPMLIWERSYSLLNITRAELALKAVLKYCTLFFTIT